MRKDGTRFWANVVITALRDRVRRATSASPRSRATSPSAARQEETLRQSEERFRLLVEGVPRLRDLHARSRRPRRDLERRRRAHQGLRGRARSSASTSRSSTRPRPSPRGKPEHELEVAAREGRFEDEGWRAAQGRHALLGQRRHHRPARRTRRAARLRQGHPRPDRAPARGDARGGGPADRPSSWPCSVTSCATRWRRSATRWRSCARARSRTRR